MSTRIRWIGALVVLGGLGGLWVRLQRSREARTLVPAEGSPSAAQSSAREEPDLVGSTTEQAERRPIAAGRRVPGRHSERPVASTRPDETPPLINVRSFVRVLDGTTGEPVSGALVTLDGSPVREAHTDADGRADLASSTERDDTVNVEKDGFALASKTIHGCAEPSHPCEIRLLRLGTLEARVADARGTPLAGILVSVASDEWSWNSVRLQATTDAGGKCVLRGLPPREDLSVELRNASKERPAQLPAALEWIQLEPGEHRAWSGVVPEGVTVQGIVVDESGAPERGLDVLLFLDSTWRGQVAGTPEFSTSSDSGGRFVFEDVPMSRWRVELGPSEGESSRLPAARPVVVRLAPGELPSPITLVVSRGQYIRGRVVQPDGAAWWENFVWGWSSGLVVDTSWSENGEFVLGPLARGEYELTADGGGVFGESETVLVQPPARDVVLKLREVCQLPVRVVDSRGHDVKAEVVPLPSDRVSRWGDYVAEGNGENQLRVPPGLYHIVARKGNDQIAWLPGVRVEAGKPCEERVLQLEDAAVLRLRVRGASPRGLECLASVDGLDLTGTSFASNVARLVVPPGRVEVRFVQHDAGDPSPPSPRLVQVTAGQERELAFDLEPAPR